VLCVATFTDLRSGRIPKLAGNSVSTGGDCGFPLASDWQGNIHGFGWHGLGQSFAGLGLGLLVFGFLFWLGGMGGGT